MKKRFDADLRPGASGNAPKLDMRIADRLLSGGNVFVLKTVRLEFEWLLLRSVAGSSRRFVQTERERGGVQLQPVGDAEFLVDSGQVIAQRALAEV